MVLRALRDSFVNVVDRLQGHAKLGDEGLGSDDALIGGQRCGALDGLDALVDDVGVTHVMGAEKALEHGAPRKLGGLEGWPLREDVAEDGGVFVVKPLQDVRAVVLQGTGEAIGDAHFFTDEAAAMFDDLLEGAHLGALAVEGFEFVAVLEQGVELEFGVRKVVLGVAEGEGLVVLGEREGIDRKERVEIIEHWLDERPHVVRDFPDCWLSVCVYDNCSMPYRGELSSDYAS
jgi:hypothetical protein